MKRSYLRVTPTSASLVSNEIPQVLASLHRLSDRHSRPIISRVNPFNGRAPLRFEFVVLSEGNEEPVKFYYGADSQLDVLKQRLYSMYPPSFDIERVTVDIVKRLIEPVEYDPAAFQERVESGRIYSRDSPAGARDPDSRRGADGVILARPALETVRPVGVRWWGAAERRQDWMTTLKGFSSRDHRGPGTADAEAPTARAPLAPLVDHLTEAGHPMAFQVVFRGKSDWSKQARRRAGALLDGTDTLLQKFLSIESSWPNPGTRGSPRGRQSVRTLDSRPSAPRAYGSGRLCDREKGHSTRTRLDLIRENTTKRTFTANARLLVLLGEDGITDDLEARLDTVCSVFDPITGPYYELEGKRFGEGGLASIWRGRGDAALEHFRNRSVCTRRRDRLPRLTNRADARPDLVVNADELANLVVVPSAADLTVEGGRGTRAQQRSRNPLPRPHHDITRRLRDPGLELGYLLDETGEPETEPISLPVDLLPFHIGRFAKTGAGKSIALLNDALSVYEQTTGPVFIIDTKGGGLPENYMRAHAKRFGFEDLESNVRHFDIPDILPGFAFFNIEPALANGVPRQQAVKDRIDHYVEILKMVMGEERYEQAVVSPNLLKYILRLMYDEEHGREYGRGRESVNYFEQSQLEQFVDQLYEAGPPDAEPSATPQSSNGTVASKLDRHLAADPRTFANIMGGVSNRMDYISADPFLRRIFDTTEPRFDLRDVLDENVVVIFDLGDLRADAAKVMAGVILTNLYDAVTERDPTALAALPDGFVVNLLIDEAASLVVSDVLNDLLEQGREFQLSVELVSQFPEQVELEGDRTVYLNVLNNIGAPIVGKIAVDDEIARALAHEEMDPVAFRNRVRALPRGEWIAQVPSPTFGETGPMPFSIAPLPIPAGHPEGERPLTADEKHRFEDALDNVHERTQSAYGVPVTANDRGARVPESISDTLDLATDRIDELLAVMARYVQLSEGGRETNDWVSVRDVDDLLETWYVTEFPGTDVDQSGDPAEAPSRAELAEVRERSPLIELSVDTDRDETVMRLTETGQQTAVPETGTVQAAGGAEHDDALGRVEAALTRAGYLVVPARQDGSELPDGWAVHPAGGGPLALEIETTTYTKPAKVLTNLQRAHSNGSVPVFVVPPGEEGPEAETAIANRVANILADPVKARDNDGVVLYTSTAHITFRGGADSENGVTAVRPVAAEAETQSNRTRWLHNDGEYILVDEAETVHARVDGVDTAAKDQFPATYSVDPETGAYLVHVPGELPRRYDAESEFREDWVPIKRPFVPETDLPEPEFGPETYAIVVLRASETETASRFGELAFYEDGHLAPLEALTEALQAGELQPVVTESDRPEPREQEDQAPAAGEAATSVGDEADDSQAGTDTAEAVQRSRGADAGVAAFAGDRLVESPGNVIPFRTVYDAYEEYIDARQFESKPANHFTRVLKDELSVESKRKWLDGKARQCYIGVDLVDATDPVAGGEVDGGSKDGGAHSDGQ